MSTFIGVKLVKLVAMTLGVYNTYRDWELPADENGADAGYLVEYLDGGKPNDERHKGYITWTPKGVCDKAYRSTDGMTFGLATEAAKMGKRVAREGWDGTGMFAFVVPGRALVPSEVPSQIVLGRLIGCDDSAVVVREHWRLFTAQKDISTWAPSGSDSLADDWYIVD